MRIFTIATQDNGEIKISGDLPLQEVKNLIEAMTYQQAFGQGVQAERQRIRQGYKAKRRKSDGKRK